MSEVGRHVPRQYAAPVLEQACYLLGKDWRSHLRSPPNLSTPFRGSDGPPLHFPPNPDPNSLLRPMPHHATLEKLVIDHPSAYRPLQPALPELARDLAPSPLPLASEEAKAVASTLRPLCGKDSSGMW